VNLSWPRPSQSTPGAAGQGSKGTGKTSALPKYSQLLSLGANEDKSSSIGSGAADDAHLSALEKALDVTSSSSTTAGGVSGVSDQNVDKGNKSSLSVVKSPPAARPPPPLGPPPPPPPLGECKIYIVDPSVELAPGLGLPSCNLSTAWPFDHQGEGITGLGRIPHWAAEHASGHWVTEAIRRSPYHHDNIKNADLVYVDM